MFSIGPAGIHPVTSVHLQYIEEEPIAVLRHPQSIALRHAAGLGIVHDGELLHEHAAYRAVVVRGEEDAHAGRL